MFRIFRGQRPDVTPAQLAAILVAGVPAVATLLSTFGIYDLDREQQDALGGVLTWGAVLAGFLIGGDATLRTARNVAGKRDAAPAMAGAAQAAGPLDPEAVGIETEIVVVPDEDEFAAQGAFEHVNGHGRIDDPDQVGAHA